MKVKFTPQPFFPRIANCEIDGNSPLVKQLVIDKKPIILEGDANYEFKYGLFNEVLIEINQVEHGKYQLIPLADIKITETANGPKFRIKDNYGFDVNLLGSKYFKSAKL